VKQKLMVGLVLAGVQWLALASVAVPAAEGYGLSLSEALRMALENNLDLISARTEPDISAEQVAIEEAGYDFSMAIDPTHSESKQEISNLFSLNEFTSDTGSVSIGKKLKFGADYGIELGLERDEAAGPLVVTPTTYSADLGLSFTLPLIGSMNGTSAGRVANTERLVLAQGNLEISRHGLLLDALRVMEETENAYWNVVASQAVLATRRVALTRSQELLALNKKKVEVGTLAPIEITQADAGVASNEEQVIIAEMDLANAEDDLRRLLNIPEGDPLWAMPVHPTDRPDIGAAAGIDLEQAMATALASRPEVLSARQTLRNDELSEKVARLKQRPGVALRANLRPAGNNFETLFDDMGQPTGQVSEGTFDEAITEIKDFDNYTWSVGVDFNYTIGNRAAKANYSVAGLNRHKSEIALENQEQLIRVDVRRAVRAVESGAKRIEAAQKNVVLQQKKLEAEHKKFENGMSTSFEVLTFQNDLAEAELGSIQAALDYTRARTSLERSKGTLLEARGLSLDTE